MVPVDRSYPYPSHRLDQSSRLPHVLEWVQRLVDEQGGQASVVGFGRTDRRTLGKVAEALPDQYKTMLVRPHGSNPSDYHLERGEVVLEVKHREAPWGPRRVHEIYDGILTPGDDPRRPSDGPDDEPPPDEDTDPASE